MQTINSTLQEQQKAGRWIVILSRAFFVDDDSKRIVLDRFNLEDSLKKMVAWADNHQENTANFFFTILHANKRNSVTNTLMTAL